MLPLLILVWAMLPDMVELPTVISCLAIIALLLGPTWLLVIVTVAYEASDTFSNLRSGNRELRNIITNTPKDHLEASKILRGNSKEAVDLQRLRNEDRKEIEALNAHIQDQVQLRIAAENEVENFCRDGKVKDEEIASLKVTANSQATRLSELQTQVQQQENRASQAETSLNTALRRADVTAKNIARQSKQFEVRIASLEEQKQEIRDLHIQARKERDEALVNVQEKEEHIEELKERIEGLEDDQKHLKKRRTQLKAQIKKLEELPPQLEKAWKEKEQSAKELTAIKKFAEEKAKELSDEKGKSQKLERDCQKSQSNLDHARTNFKVRIHALEGEVDRLQQSNDNLWDEKSKATNEARGHQKTTETLKRSIAKRDSKITELEAKDKDHTKHAEHLLITMSKMKETAFKMQAAHEKEKAEAEQQVEHDVVAHYEMEMRDQVTSAHKEYDRVLGKLRTLCKGKKSVKAVDILKTLDGDGAYHRSSPGGGGGDDGDSSDDQGGSDDHHGATGKPGHQNDESHVEKESEKEEESKKVEGSGSADSVNQPGPAENSNDSLQPRQNALQSGEQPDKVEKAVAEEELQSANLANQPSGAKNSSVDPEPYEVPLPEEGNDDLAQNNNHREAQSASLPAYQGIQSTDPQATEDVGAVPSNSPGDFKEESSKSETVSKIQAAQSVPNDSSAIPTVEASQSAVSAAEQNEEKHGQVSPCRSQAPGVNGTTSNDTGSTEMIDASQIPLPVSPATGNDLNSAPSGPNSRSLCALQDRIVAPSSEQDRDKPYHIQSQQMQQLSENAQPASESPEAEMEDAPDVANQATTSSFGQVNVASHQLNIPQLAPVAPMITVSTYGETAEATAEQQSNDHEMTGLEETETSNATPEVEDLDMADEETESDEDEMDCSPAPPQNVTHFAQPIPPSNGFLAPNNVQQMPGNGMSAAVWGSPSTVTSNAANTPMSSSAASPAFGNLWIPSRTQEPSININTSTPSPFSQAPVSTSPFSIPVFNSRPPASSQTGTLASTSGQENRGRPTGGQPDGYARFLQNATPSHTLIEGSNWRIGANGRVEPTSTPSSTPSGMSNNATTPRFSPTDPTSRPSRPHFSPSITATGQSPAYFPTSRFHLPCPLNTPVHRSPLSSSYSPQDCANAMARALSSNTGVDNSPPSTESPGANPPTAASVEPSSTQGEPVNSAREDIAAESSQMAARRNLEDHPGGGLDRDKEPGSDTPAGEEGDPRSSSQPRRDGKEKLTPEEQRKQNKAKGAEYTKAVQNADLESIYDRFPQRFLDSSDDEDADGQDAAPQEGNTEAVTQSDETGQEDRDQAHSSPPTAETAGMPPHGQAEPDRDGNESTTPAEEVASPRNQDSSPASPTSIRASSTPADGSGQSRKRRRSSADGEDHDGDDDDNGKDADGDRDSRSPSGGSGESSHPRPKKQRRPPT